MSVIDETVLSLSFVTLVIKDQQRKWLSNAFSKEIGEEFAAKKLHVELQSEKGACKQCTWLRYLSSMLLELRQVQLLEARKGFCLL